MSAIYRLRLLGPVQVERAGKPVRGFESHKALALLGYLSARHHPLNRTYLANLFWQDKSEARGRGNLSRVLHNLSSLLPACLIADRDTIQFRCADTYWLDTRAFEELVARGEASALTTAVELYRDEFMAGIFLDDCPEFETWLVTERERWRQRVAQVLQTLIAYHTQRGECEPGIRLASRWLDLDPWREEAHRQKMLLLALSGQRSDALAQYETCCRLLADELNTEPTQETTTLYAQIRDGAIAPLPPPPVSPPHNLPAPLTPFIGRAAELVRIAERLANPDCRLITLVGPGGIGKTRLALQAATANVHAFADGVFLVPLAPVSSPDLIVPAIAHALKLSFRGATDPQAQLLDHLRAKKMLLVLDSFEHLLPPARAGDEGEANLLIEILRNAPQLKIFVTSRERLNLQAEWLLEVEGLSYPEFRFQNSEFRLKDTGGATENLQSTICNLKFSAMELFVQGARRVHADFSLEAEWAGTLRICHLTRGMPLAIELAAASTHDFSCQAIATEIERDLNFLATTMRDVPERHRSVRAAFEHSWRLLGEPERRAFSRLAVFRGGFDAEAAEQIADASHTLLAMLVDKSLLHQDASGRYEMHELVRQYAGAKLEETGGAPAVRGRHLEYYMTMSAQAGQGLSGSDQRAWLERLDTEHDNMRVALGWSLASEASEAGLRLAGALQEFWLVRGYLSEGRRWLEQLIAQGDRAAPSWRAKALHGAGTLACAQRDYEPARVFLEKGLALKRTLGDKQGMALSLNNLGSVAILQGQYQQARSFYEESLSVKRELGDKRGIAFALCNLGAIAFEQGDYERAEALFEESLVLRRALKDDHGIAASLTNLGSVAYARGDFGRARALHEEGLSLCRELGDKEYVINVLANLGVALIVLGDLKQARVCLEESRTISRELMDKERLAYALNRLGDITYAEGDAQCAEALYKESLALYRESGNKVWLHLPLGGLARLADEFGQSKKAVRLFGAAEGIRQVLGMRLPPPERATFEHWVAAARARLSEGTFAEAWAQGQTMPLEQAIQYAMER